MFRRLILIAVVSLLIAVCAKAGEAQRGKTEVLQADGGELGKAFVELKQALKTADKARAAKLLDPSVWHLDNKKPEWFAQLNERLTQYSAVGGRRQGDRATLFVVNEVPYYALMNATYAAGGWRFDTPSPPGSSFSSPPRNCKAFPTRFPCAALSAPEALISGVVQSHRVDPETKKPFPPFVLFDGLAVRMLDGQTKALKATWIVLSGTGLNPQMVSLSEEPDDVTRWLSYPVLTLYVAPDGKSAKAYYYDGYSPKEFDVIGGLHIDTKTPNRIRGQLKTDMKDAAKFDITFDIGTASDCLDEQYHCGD